jgi:hypothetical protein
VVRWSRRVFIIIDGPKDNGNPLETPLEIGPVVTAPYSRASVWGRCEIGGSHHHVVHFFIMDEPQVSPGHLKSGASRRADLCDTQVMDKLQVQLRNHSVY